jgi:thioredoxin/glutathione reductase (selenoprotein)
MPGLKYMYDFVVIGGGSGGLAAAKQALKANPKLKVACFDYVKPSPAGTKWGLGGTCVNVGCIPKKLFHYSGLQHTMMEDAKALGWKNLDDAKNDWPTMVRNVDQYIRSLNFNYKKELVDAPVEYINAYASFKDPHTIAYETKKGEKKEITADQVLVVVGGRPRYPDIPGAELGISSDDIFWRKTPPGKTLVVGASYIALECAGFMHELGYDVSVMVRSILLRGFDEQAACQIGEHMERNGVRFIKPATPTRLERKGGDPKKGPITVTWTHRETGEESSEEFDTVLYAIGRDAVVDTIGLDAAGVEVKHGKILTDDKDQTNVPHIHAIGDCALDRPELTPVAIKAGQLLADRLFSGKKRLMDYKMVPTVVFTPLEYGTVGLSQEDAIKELGAENLNTYLIRYGYLEEAATDREEIPKVRSRHFHEDLLWARQHAKKHNKEFEEFKLGSFEWEEDFRTHLKQPMLAKLICDKNNNDRVVGFHYIGPQAGEVTQGFALAIKLGATKADFDELSGIHPTSAEEFTSLGSVTLESGEDFMKQGGC